LEALASELRERHGRRVEVLACDVSEATERIRLIDEIKKLDLNVDVLALSAGFGLGGPFISSDLDRITAMVRTNVEAVMALTNMVLPAMAERRKGAVLIVSSMAGNQPMPNFGAYAATKAAITSFAESLHSEVKSCGVVVTALCPGGVTTEFSQVGGLEHVEKRTPSSILIGPEECARAGINGLERGSRVVMPRLSVRAFAWFGSHAPRAVWLPLCRKMFA
jgi:hypothetical protein